MLSGSFLRHNFEYDIWNNYEYRVDRLEYRYKYWYFQALIGFAVGCPWIILIKI
jgi:hypothetical protein